MRYRWFYSTLPLAIGFLLILACPVHASIKPDQLLLVVNKAVPEGLRIARYYMEKRHVPRQNVITLETFRGEDIGREDYDGQIAAPVRSFLLKNDPREEIPVSCSALRHPSAHRPFPSERFGRDTHQGTGT